MTVNPKRMWWIGDGAEPNDEFLDRLRALGVWRIQFTTIYPIMDPDYSGGDYAPKHMGMACLEHFSRPAKYGEFFMMHDDTGTNPIWCMYPFTKYALQDRWERFRRAASWTPKEFKNFLDLRRKQGIRAKRRNTTTNPGGGCVALTSAKRPKRRNRRR